MKIFNLSHTAQKLGVTRQTIYYWIKKGWINTKRDYRNYPVFTEKDIEKIKKWKDKLKVGL